jgi:hypothetical protein
VLSRAGAALFWTSERACERDALCQAAAR